MYTIHADAEGARVRARLSGFFDIDEVNRFSREEQDAAQQVLSRHDTFDLLIETPEGPAQGQDTLEAFRRLILASPLKARRIAIVSSSALLRMQVRRVLASDRVQVFEATTGADAWLDEDDTASAG